jgi:hypothetical protein
MAQITLDFTTEIVVLDFSLVIIQHSTHGFEHTIIFFGTICHNTLT